MDKSVKALLKSQDCSWTRPRALIFEALRAGPSTLPELAYILRAKVDRATVYRTVALFEELGIAQRVWSGWTSVVELSDRFSKHHHHLVCENCGRLKDFADDELEKAIGQLSGRLDVRVFSHHLELFGHCLRCSNNINQPSRSRTR